MQGASQQAGNRLYDAKLAALTKLYGARKRSPPKVTILGANPRNPPKMAFPSGSRPGTRMTPQRKRRGPVSRLHRNFVAVGRSGGSFVAASPSSLAPVALRAAGPHAPQPEIKYLATRCGIRHHNGILEPIRHP